MPTEDHQFKPGQSGNPAGRKKGECKKYQLFKQLVEPHTKQLVNQAISIALSESKDRTKILTIFLEHVLPSVIKDNILNPEIELKDGSLFEQAEHIKNLVSDKHLTPEQGNTLISAVKTIAEIKYKEDLEKDVEALKDELKSLKQELNL